MPVDSRATLSTVAHRAGVSRQTVSNAMNSPEMLRPETLARVQQAIAELGYRPSRAAKALRTGAARAIGLALPPKAETGAGGVGDRFLHAVATAARNRGYRILLLAASSDDDELDQYEEVLAAREIESVLLTGTHHGDPRTAWLSREGVSFVTFGRPWGAQEEGTTHAWVDVDGAAGTDVAVTHLAALGHTRIGFVGWPAGSGVGDDRRAGWLRAVHRLRLAPAEQPSAWVARTDNDVRDARSAAATLIAERSATAVVCVSDTVALGALRAASEHPHTVAVAGFDDTPVAAAVGLTSLAQPLEVAAESAVALLLDERPAGTTPPPTHILLDPDLQVRESTGSRVATA
ncbi:LacI family DNA-binding transcriptional regulator [Georgenia subflava]|uniref:LacI family DNA-binding transcriptional regulator n=1 Tax=Georgenia subflava TaxID=1622177 RepID=A0A6N7EJQ9_9MICO|nr:substrate-binding domain-containing protein [Georgenia subflava]MPV37298.1 LacI family DNA-binding transcriptional regulator [Georgenia subflava]